MDTCEWYPLGNSKAHALYSRLITEVLIYKEKEKHNMSVSIQLPYIIPIYPVAKPRLAVRYKQHNMKYTIK
jgi:hypothetical protein